MSETVRRALRVLGFLGERPRKVDEVAEFMGLHRTTALRTLQVLEAERFVTRDEGHSFRLASGLYYLANRALENTDLRTVAAPHITALSAEVPHTVHLAALEARRVVYIDKREAENRVRMYSRVGNTAPLYCTGVAKAILAFLPVAVQREIADGIDYVRHTDKTITTPAGLLAELAAVARRGYATDHLEHEPFVNCVAAPVFETSGAVIGSVSITATTLVCDFEEVLTLVPRLIEATDAISEEYGWSPQPPAEEDGQEPDRTPENSSARRLQAAP